MKRYLCNLAVGVLMGGAIPLQSSVLWDGLTEPMGPSEVGRSVGPGTLVGLYCTPAMDTALESLQGFVGLPNRPVVGGRLPPLPQFGVSLWEGDLVVAAGTPQVSGGSLLGDSVGTQSGLRVWSVFCDLSSLPWHLKAGREYILAITVDLPAEWLLNNGVFQPSLVNTGNGWEALPDVTGWNARLLVTPVPEPAAAATAFAGLVLWMAGCRRIRARAASPLKSASE